MCTGAANRRPQNPLRRLRMNHNRRSHTNKGKSRSKFNNRAKKTHKLNTATPMRGGIRL